MDRHWNYNHSAAGRARKKAWDHSPDGMAFRRAWQKTAKAKAIKARWKKNHPSYHREWWLRLKEKVFSMYGDTCRRCGYADKRALQLDHVQNDGYKNRIVCKTGKKTNKLEGEWIKASRVYQPDKYQILCANCNWIKRYESSAYGLPTSKRERVPVTS